jgi:uridylate kinase
LHGKAVVVKISGRLLYPPRSSYIQGLRDAIIEAKRRGYTIGVVTGGGELARMYIRETRLLGVSEALLDLLGIEASKINALALAIALLPHSSPKIPRSIEEAVDAALSGSIPVLGGLQPGQSNNAVAASLAEGLGARVIVNMMAGLDAVYDRPPTEHGARKYSKISVSQMEELAGKNPQIAGTYELFDHVALKIVKRSKLTVLFVDGSEPSVLVEVIEDHSKAGTIMVP